MDTDALARDLAPNGALRVAINLGNPVLTQGTPDEPTGVTIDIARELARRLDVPARFICFDAARLSFAAVTVGDADLAFLAIEPVRAEQVAFTEPYVVIDGVFVVPNGSSLRTVADVDRAKVRIGVKHGSAYDLYLTRTLRHASLVRGAEGVEVFEAQHLSAGAGIRQAVTAYASARPNVRVIDEAFMQIRQALAIRKDCAPEILSFLRDLVEELRASGFVAESLQRSGQGNARVAPPA